MHLFKFMKDGGPESRVFGFFLVEIKSWFSIVLLKFENGSREAYHSHAFNALSWIFGRLEETDIDGTVDVHVSSWRPIRTSREKFHKVVSVGQTWAITFRGPWDDNWHEYIPATDGHLTLTHGREVVSGA